MLVAVREIVPSVAGPLGGVFASGSAGGPLLSLLCHQAWLVRQMELSPSISCWRPSGADRPSPNNDTDDALPTRQPPSTAILCRFERCW